MKSGKRVREKRERKDKLTTCAWICVPVRCASFVVAFGLATWTWILFLCCCCCCCCCCAFVHKSEPESRVAFSNNRFRTTNIAVAFTCLSIFLVGSSNSFWFSLPQPCADQCGSHSPLPSYSQLSPRLTLIM